MSTFNSDIFNSTGFNEESIYTGTVLVASQTRFAATAAFMMPTYHGSVTASVRPVLGPFSSNFIIPIYSGQISGSLNHPTFLLSGHTHIPEVVFYVTVGIHSQVIDIKTVINHATYAMDIAASSGIATTYTLYTAGKCQFNPNF
jgi:hypothetical protein